MDFIDEQHVVRFQIRQQRGQVARTFQHGAAGLTQIDAKFVRNDVGERCFAEARGSEEQYVIQRIPPLFGRFDEEP